MPRVLIAGCGYVGSATADLFQARGWQVEGWTHSNESAEKLVTKPYLVRAVDISDPAAVRKSAAPFDLVLHCASSGGGGPTSYQRVYLEGARNLIEQLQPPRLLFTSSTSVYAQRGGEWVDEESPAEPAHETGKILRETEELLRQNRGTVVRLAGIYGPGRAALLRKFLAGEARIEGDGSRFLNQAHRDDIAAALFLLGTTSPLESIYNVCDNEPIAQRAAFEWLARKLGCAVPETTGQSPARKRGASNKRVSNHRLRALGWSPAFPTFQSGMTAILPSILETYSHQRTS
jgi:nucleoside-diphosphate-sugar epimerase